MGGVQAFFFDFSGGMGSAPLDQCPIGESFQDFS